MVEPVSIAIITDFGTRDGYVGAMKGVLQSLSPQATLLDITHEIAPQDVGAAAYTLGRCYRYFPPDTIFLVVVDPSVGTQRKPLAIQAGAHRFVAPDNGVLTKAIQDQPIWEAVCLTQRQYWREEVSHTFHGRDIFAPVAAHWANGTPLHRFGERVADLVMLTEDGPRWERELPGFSGRVTQVDQFGNLITNIGPFVRVGSSLQWQDDAGQTQVCAANAFIIEMAGLTLRGVQSTYADAAKGEALALLDSAGQLEIAVHRGNAAEACGLSRGAKIQMRISA
ncbi:MAG: SAM-dependent chlorinase/fluorinase [Chloroflexi bacterium]|nr:SAM-dependent chlorinase/fluorinase [Chloroflexota bacterium]